jgi:hypothetical protein
VDFQKTKGTSLSSKPRLKAPFLQMRSQELPVNRRVLHNKDLHGQDSAWHVVVQTRSGDPTLGLRSTWRRLLHSCRTKASYDFRTTVCCEDTWLRRKVAMLRFSWLLQFTRTRVHSQPAQTTPLEISGLKRDGLTLVTSPEDTNNRETVPGKVGEGQGAGRQIQVFRGSPVRPSC